MLGWGGEGLLALVLIKLSSSRHKTTQVEKETLKSSSLEVPIPGKTSEDWLPGNQDAAQHSTALQALIASQASTKPQPTLLQGASHLPKMEGLFFNVNNG